MPFAPFLFVPHSENEKPRILELKTSKGGFPDKENSPNWTALPSALRSCAYSIFSCREGLHRMVMLEPDAVRAAFVGQL